MERKSCSMPLVGPTKGRFCWDSKRSGASPTKRIFPLGFPAPTTVPCRWSERLHLVQV